MVLDVVVVLGFVGRRCWCVSEGCRGGVVRSFVRLLEGRWRVRG